MVESMVFCKCYLNNLKTIWKYSWNSPFFINLKKAFIYKNTFTPCFCFFFLKCFGDISDTPNTFPICALEALRRACMSFGYFMICGPEFQWGSSAWPPVATAWSPGHLVVPWIKPLRLRTVGHLSQSFLVPGWKHLNMTGSSRFFFWVSKLVWDTFTHIRWYKKIMVFNNFFTKTTDWWFS